MRHRDVRRRRGWRRSRAKTALLPRTGLGRAGCPDPALQLYEHILDAAGYQYRNLHQYAWQGDATYAGEDQRGAFYSKLRHEDDSEIVVEVSPDETGESCVLRVLSYESGLPDESERVRRVDAIAERLREAGLQTGSATADPAPPDPALTDFGRLRQLKRAATQRA